MWGTLKNLHRFQSIIEIEAKEITFPEKLLLNSTYSEKENTIWSAYSVRSDC